MADTIETQEQQQAQGVATGFAALAFVAGHLGIETSAAELSRAYAFSGPEPDSQLLVAMAREMRLEARALNMNWRDLVRSRRLYPALIRLRDGTTLVLDRVQEGAQAGGQDATVLLHDPASGPDARVIVDQAKLKEVWDGEIILVKRRFAISDEQQPFGVPWIFGQLIRDRTIFVNIVVASIFCTVFALGPIIVIRIVFDKVMANQTLQTLYVVAGILLLLIVFELVLTLLQRHFIQTLTTQLQGRSYIYMLEKVLKLPIDFFEKTPTGTIVGRLHHLYYVNRGITGGILRTVLDGIPAVLIFPVIVFLQWRMALYLLILMVCIFGIILAFTKPVLRRIRAHVQAEIIKNTHLTETVYGMRTIKSLALEPRRRFEWDGLVGKAIETDHDLGIMSIYPSVLVQPFERLAYSGGIVLGAFMMIMTPNLMTAGELLAVVLLMNRMVSPLAGIARLQLEWAEFKGGVAQVASILNETPEESRQGTGLRLPITGQITFEGVKFRYPSASTYALDNASFPIRQGAMFGIMGRSGSGKTTVTRLLQGLHPQYEGIIKIDGMDLREIDLTHLRTHIGVVLQENFLFRGTIRENIGIAKPGATMTEIVRAAQVAGAEEFIERMPQGYNTWLQEGATNLSGGQRQRLAIARALLVDPPVLIFDEATSALDAESEAIINANLHRIAHNRTIICISHRLSMLVPADAILVLERGKVYDIGRHDELLQRCDIYKHLWHTQNRYGDKAPSNPQLAIAGVASN